MVNAFNEIIEAILRAKESMLNSRPTSIPPIFYTAGTGLTDEFAVEWFKDTNQLVMTRDGTLWKRGEKINDDELQKLRGSVERR